MSLITHEQLKLVVPTLSERQSKIIAEKINFICPKYGIKTKDVLHEFLANVAHESGGFSAKEEDMNYSAKRIMQVWPKRFTTINAARAFANNPKALANYTYGGRMGNRPGTDDGYNFRGGGYMGLTGRYTYEKYRKYTGFDNLEELADAVRTDEYYAMDSAAWVFAVELSLIPLSIKNDFLNVVRRINGGTIGMEDRLQYYERAKKYLV